MVVLATGILFKYQSKPGVFPSNWGVAVTVIGLPKQAESFKGDKLINGFTIVSNILIIIVVVSKGFNWQGTPLLRIQRRLSLSFKVLSW